MMRRLGRWRGWVGVWSVGVVFALALGPARAVTAAGASFTVTVRSAFLRAGPSVGAAPQYSVFAGEVYAVMGQSSDGTWLLLDYAGAAPGSTWIAAGLGQVGGNINLVPVSTATAAPASASAAPAAAEQEAAGGPAGPVYYTVSVKSLFGRAGPDLKAAKIASLFRGQRYAADARSADGLWLRLNLPGGPGWAPAAYGTVTGAAALLPVGAPATSPAAAAAAPSATPAPVAATITVSAAARAVYQRGLALGNNPQAFSKIGDCNSATPYFLAPFDKGEYRLGDQYAYLQATIEQFAGSFNRDGAVARDGLNTASVFDPIWSPPGLCQRGESPLACELRTHQPSMAFISLGTNGGWQTDAEYDANMRKIIDFAIERGVLPILSTKADNLEGDGRFNRIVRQLAAEYELPLWDWANVAWTLPGGGLADDYHLVWGQPYYDTAPTPLLGWQARNLTALQMLDAVWHGAK
ncbi:MAG: SGNH/GDSL hydrolase family protein [Anaerolineales bacterium]|nr:SGNH/GDSL hydrolase family protein [Anaerolineales bacterium]